MTRITETTEFLRVTRVVESDDADPPSGPQRAVETRGVEIPCVPGRAATVIQLAPKRVAGGRRCG
jgi:hypothetical protein